VPYQKRNYRPGDTFAAEDANYIQTQYDEAAADLATHKSASPIDHPDGSVTLAKLASSAMTSPGGTEPNRLAVTDGGGAVGRAREASDAIRVQGGVPFATTPNLSDIGLHQFSNSPGTDGAWVTIASVINSGVLLGGTVAGPDINLKVRITVDGVATVINAVREWRIVSSETINYERCFVVLPPIVFRSSLKIEWSTTESGNSYRFGGMVWIREG